MPLLMTSSKIPLGFHCNVNLGFNIHFIYIFLHICRGGEILAFQVLYMLSEDCLLESLKALTSFTI